MHSQVLTDILLQERDIEPDLPFSLHSVVQGILADESSKVWVIHGSPYLDIFEGFGAALRAHRVKDLQIRVFEGCHRTLYDFLGRQEDLVVVHEADEMHKPDDILAELYLRSFLHIAQAGSSRVVFLSSFAFSTGIPLMNHVNVTDGQILNDTEEGRKKVNKNLACFNALCMEPSECCCLFWASQTPPGGCQP